MKTLQIKGSGLAERPSDPVERMGNPSNKPEIRQTNLEIRQTDFDVKRMAPGPPKIRLTMSNGWVNLSNGYPSNKKSNGFLSNGFRQTDSWIRLTGSKIRQTKSLLNGSVKQILGSVKQIRLTFQSVKQKNQTDLLSNGSVKQMSNPSNKKAC